MCLIVDFRNVCVIQKKKIKKQNNFFIQNFSVQSESSKKFEEKSGERLINGQKQE